MNLHNPMVFEVLQPLCVEILKTLDKQKLQELNKQLRILENSELVRDSSEKSINVYKEYLTLPLVLGLKRLSDPDATFKSRHDLLEEVLSCLHCIHSNALITEWSFFRDVFHHLFLCLTSPSNPQKLSTVDEDCQCTALRCVASLVRASSEDVLQSMCHVSFRAQLGHGIYVILKLAQEEKSIALKTASFDCLMVVGLKFCYDDIGTSLQNNLSHTMTNFLPGIVLACTKVANAGDVQNHKVTVAALECWAHFVKVVMRDKFLLSFDESLGCSDTYVTLHEKLFPSTTTCEPLSSSGKVDSAEHGDRTFLELKQVDVTREWIKSTSKNLLVLVQTLCKLISNSHWEVRCAVIGWANTLLTHCSRSLGDGVLHLFEVITTLQHDLFPEVLEMAKCVMSKHRSLLVNSTDDGRIADLLKERIFVLVSRLPTVIRSEDDTSICLVLNQLYGNLDLLGASLHDLTSQSTQVNCFLKAFSLLFTPDVSDAQLLMERIVREECWEELNIPPSLGHSFHYFHSSAIYDQAAECLLFLGLHGNVHFLLDTILDMVMCSTCGRNEHLQVLNLLMAGLIKRDDLMNSEKEGIVSHILESFKEMGIFSLPLKVHSGSEHEITSDSMTVVQLSSCSSIQGAKTNVLIMCNALKVIGNCARVCHAMFDQFLSDVLMFVLEKAGVSNVLVAYTATKVLDILAEVSPYNTVLEFVEASFPQFWFCLSQQLKRLPEYPSAPVVLRTALRCSRGKMLVFVEELVEDILDCLDVYHSVMGVPLLTVFLIYVESVKKFTTKVEEQEPRLDASSSCDFFLHKASTSTDTCTGVSALIPDISTPHNSRLGSVALFLKDYNEKHMETSKAFEIEREDFQEMNQTDCQYENTSELMDKDPNVEESELQECMLQENDRAKPGPKYVELVRSILEKCSFLLHVKDREMQLTILDLIETSCHIFAGNDDIKLPCYHKLWNPLTLRLKGEDCIVMLRAMEICVLLAETSGDFLRKRFLKEIFPPVIMFLESQRSANMNKNVHKDLLLTPTFKSQKVFLTSLPKLMKGLDFGSDEISEVLRVAVMYLEPGQPDILTERAVHVVVCAASIKPDLTWFVLAHTRHPFLIQPPTTIFSPCQIHSRNFVDLPPDAIQIYERLSFH